jgi:hypothetical protein
LYGKRLELLRELVPSATKGCAFSTFSLHSGHRRLAQINCARFERKAVSFSRRNPRSNLSF